MRAYRPSRLAAPLDPGTSRRARRTGWILLGATLGLPVVLLALWVVMETMLNQPFGRSLFWEGADTEIVVYNASGQDIREFEVRVAGHRIRVEGLLETRREDDPDQNVVHYRDMIFSRVRPLTFPLEIAYEEADTGVVRTGSVVANRRPRRECKFVIFLRAEGPEFSECRRPERKGLSVR